MNKGIPDRDRMLRVAFSMIRFMHDNALLRLVVDPARLLRDLGVRPRDTVLEVGCGPGFFTVGAAAAVGPEGRVVAYEVNPYACAYVERKLAAWKLGQAVVRNVNAIQSGLPDRSVDFVFVTGVPRVVGGLSALLTEMCRVLKPEGSIAFRPSRGDTAALNAMLGELGMARTDTRRRFLIFQPRL